MSDHNLFPAVHVSRETLAKLHAFAALLRKWNPTINLIGKTTLDDIWRRHFLDSAQLWPYVPDSARTAADFGSGAGFPAIILALVVAERQKPLVYHLVESDARKAAFLSNAARELDLALKVVNGRLESANLPPADLVTARAFAPLSELVRCTVRVRRPDGKALFLKGRSVDKELDEARRLWDFEYRLHASLTDAKAAVVEIGAIHGPK